MRDDEYLARRAYLLIDKSNKPHHHIAVAHTRAMHTLAQLRSGALAGITRLSLSEGLTEFPPEIFDLAETLEILDLSGNRLSALPDDLTRLKKLRIVFASNNAFSELPSVLGACETLSMIGFKANRITTVSPESLSPHLRWLVLTDNAIAALPDAIGGCSKLQKLMLAGNRLSALPNSMTGLERLELLRLAANDFAALPGFLTGLPRLSWLAFAGNPFVPDLPPASAATIAWDDLTIGATLGEGASGVISRAMLHGEPVAVKVFKGAVTSDGLPRSEMAACLHTGGHPNLIPVRGKVTGRDALVMDLIGPEFTTLAGPPSFETCTRDVYAPGTQMTADAAHRIACGIASAARHLHGRGIMHGDLYAHNILHNVAGEALIGDFGAASFYAGERPDLQRLEVRAFGCLLEELAVWDTTLSPLAEACLGSNRPLFADIEAALD